MLKYQLNVNKIKNDIVPIVLNEYSIEALQGDAFKDKKMLACYTEEDIDFDMGANIVSMYEQYMVNDDFISSTAYNFNTIYHPFGVNKGKKFFSLLFDAYFFLTADRTSIITDEDNNEWWYIWFNGSHLFETENGQTYTLYVGYNTASGYTKGEIEVSADNVVTNSVLRFEKRVLESLDNLEWKELRNVIFFEEDGRQISDLTNVSFFRDNFIFTDGMFSLFLDRATEGVVIPLSQKFSNDLLQDELINHDFVNEERRKAINRITDMEKDIYYPVIWDTANKRIYYSNSGGKVKNGEVYNIEFNLHFRKHEGDNWLVSPTSYWNGVNDNATFYSNSNGFFNTAYPNKESQPDLLTYLGFTNNDVKYQKNKLKKSFLRLMFFDSMSPTNQNLLAYYTVFMDSGGYFSKFVKHVELADYYKAPADGGNAITDLVGLRVDREPTIDERGELIQERTVDEVRLGTRFIISDKYSSDASSEGFYLYLWKDNFEGTVPQDIYMKVEFNHAGYGRTIPFMMPFWDNKKWSDKEGIKTFEEILADWRTEPNTDGPYGIQQYLKYSYIHFKYCYDKTTKRHVYYLDDKFYGTDPSKGGVHFTNNKITLNLYEAKIV